MKTYTRDDTEHDVEYVLKSDAMDEIDSALQQRNAAVSQLHTLQDLIVEVFEPNVRPTSISEYRKLLERNAGSGIHTCHQHCDRPACRLRRERDQLARWKKEQLTVESWWKEIDTAVRNHPDTILGDTIAHTALRFIRERDELLGKEKP